MKTSQLSRRLQTNLQISAGEHKKCSYFARRLRSLLLSLSWSSLSLLPLFSRCRSLPLSLSKSWLLSLCRSRSLSKSCSLSLSLLDNLCCGLPLGLGLRCRFLEKSCLSLLSEDDLPASVKLPNKILTLELHHLEAWPQKDKLNKAIHTNRDLHILMIFLKEIQYAQRNVWKHASYDTIYA